MPVRLITPPASEPVTLAEAKDHLRLQTALDDSYVNSLISAARQYTEQICGRGLITQTWELILESFQGEDTLDLGMRGRRYGSGQNGYAELPRGNLSSGDFLPYIELPKGNVAALGSVKYIDSNGVQQTLANTEYTVDDADVPGRVRLAYGKYWPPTQWPRWDAVRIVYDVGWEVEDLPTPLKQAVLMLVSQLYEHRSPEVLERRVSPVAFAFDALISPYRLVRL